MKRLLNIVLAACMLLLVTGSAFASSHGAMPAGISLVEMVLWEIQHFALHMLLTFQALELMFVSPSLGLAMLGEQTLCASASPLVGALFGTAPAALVTFAITIMALAALLAWVAFKAKHALPTYTPSASAA